MNRRAFLKRGLAAGGMAAAPCFVPAPVLGGAGRVAPSERVTVAVIGKGAMGSGHLRWGLRTSKVQVLGVCEVDGVRREAARAATEEAYADLRKQGTYRGVLAVTDYRELLQRPDLDGVIIVTPDHWHALMAIDAAKAGKDVYSEKPISLTIEEGQRVTEVVRRYGRVFQTGTQYRSIPTVRRVCAFVRSGGLGRVKSVFVLFNPLRDFIGGGRYARYARELDLEHTGRSYAPLDFHLPGQPVPEGLDWDLWLGPAPWRPYHELYHVNPSPGVVPWSFCEDFGVASLTWHLAHSADVVHYGMGMERSGPVEIIHPSEGKYPTLTCRYANGTLLHLVDHWGMVKDLYQAVPGDARLAGNFGGVFVGERGWVTSMSVGGPVEGGPVSLLAEMGLKTRDVNIGANDHHANWLDCIRTRRAPSSDEEIGHRSASLGHLAMVSCALGRSLRWDPVREEFPGEETANRLRARTMREPWRS